MSIAKDVQEIKLALIGDKKLGVPGLVKRQEADEIWKVKVDQKLDTIDRKIESHAKKIDVIYPVFSIFHYIGKTKKGIIIFFAALGSLGLIVWHKFETFIDLFKH